MADMEELSIAELQQKVKEAATYQERSAIRKVLHRKQLRGGGGKNIGGGSPAPSGATVKRRPSRESRSIGVIRDIVRRDSDVADDRSSPELGYTPTGRKDSVMNNNNSPLEQLSPAPKENGRHQAPEPEETTADFSPEANKENVEVDAPKPSQDPPVPKPKPSRPASEPEVPKVEEEVQVVPDSRNSRVSSSQAPEEVQEHMTERELESAIARSSDYNQRRELRARLRKLRSENRKGGSRGRFSQASESEGSREREPVPVQTPTKQEQPTLEVSTSAEPEEQVQADIPEKVESRQEQDELPQQTDEDTKPAGAPESGAINVVVEDTDPNEARVEGSASLDDDEDKVLRKSVTEPVNKYDHDKGAALAGDEGVADFRSVLRKSPSPGSSQPNVAKASEAEQVDFRKVLKAETTPVKRSHLEVGEQKYRSSAPKQEDFRNQLKRKVDTKDCSSAAPKRSAAPKQDDFRGLLKKPTEEGGRSPRRVLTPSASPPSRNSPLPSGSDRAQEEGADEEVRSHMQEETETPGKSPVPPPVKAKPKVSPRPSPVPPQMQREEEVDEQPLEAEDDDQRDETEDDGQEAYGEEERDEDEEGVEE